MSASLKADLTAERARELLAYDPETGALMWRVAPSNRLKAWARAGTRNTNGYISVRVDRRFYLAHRLAWLITYGAWPNGQVDHRDGDRTNNRLANLRIVSQAGNSQNVRKARADNRTGLLGVTHRRGRFRATITVGGAQRHLGDYDTPEEAHAAYLAAKREHHHTCTI